MLTQGGPAQYTTPTALANITGGIGTGGSGSGSGYAVGGDGSQFADTSGSSTGAGSGSTSGGDAGGSTGGSTDGDSGGGGGGGSSVGAIAGGVIGGIVALALLAFIAIVLMRKRRRERQMNEAANARDKLGAGYGAAGGPLRSNSGSSDGRWGTPYEKQPMYWSGAGRGSGSADHSSRTQFAASDDVEEDTRGMDFAGSAHLTPKQQCEFLRRRNRTKGRGADLCLLVVQCES